MSIVLNRIDDRLVHGQVLVSWLRKLKAQRLVVVDRQLARDQFFETVLAMSLPAGIELKVFDVRQGSAYLQECENTLLPRTILLMKSPQVARELWDEGYRPASLNIGAMAAGPFRRQFCKNMYATPEELDILREFARCGTDVYVQVVSAENRIEISELLCRRAGASI